MKVVIQKHFEDNADKTINKDGQIKIVRGRATLYANRRLKNWQDAEDCVQEAYTRALFYSDGFKEGSDFDCWFFIILANVINNHIYRKDIAPEIIDIEEELSAEDEPFYTPKDPSLVDNIDKKDLSIDVKSVLTMYYKYGHKASHISQILQIPPNKVRQVLQEFGS